ncbi:hypothetical protein HHK36_032180 [Tetracentron sinense]|uniref:FCP1 homology domain-containing protein n=1 Tax=Tetracentron sinense TaxID=13715 RepID=A0A834YAQ8_TETSI|nr:hypothetical protein HHK36_032180 [Tetracentron sinense]
MQTKKKPVGRNSAREHASPRVCRQTKKVAENVQNAEKKVTELITSSVRKQRFPGILSKKKEPVAAKNLNTGYILAHDETQDICLGHEANEASVDHKVCTEGTAQRVLGTIFSPSYHISKDGGGGIADGVNFIKYFGSKDQKVHQNCGTEESQVDMMKSYDTLETSDSVRREGDKNYSQDNRTVVATLYPSGMDMDATISSENSDVQNNGWKMPPSETNAVNSHYNEDVDGANLSVKVASIFFAMQNSKLECVDEPNQDPMSTEVCVEADDFEEIDDFDPYLFIKNLPDLSSVVPTFRPMLLPKQTRRCPPTTLVLDLDETLVHSTLEHCDDADFTFPVTFNLKEHIVYVRCRPHLKFFMERAASLFEIIIFTASQSIYAEKLLNVLDPKRRIFRHRVYRESCVFVEGNYLKDLSVLGRDLARVMIIDNSPQAFGFQVDNGIPIESWFEDPSDQELLSLLPFLESLVGVEDVRPLIAKKFNLREKVTAAVYPSLNSNKGDPFER